MLQPVIVKFLRWSGRQNGFVQALLIVLIAIVVGPITLIPRAAAAWDKWVDEASQPE